MDSVKTLQLPLTTREYKALKKAKDSYEAQAGDRLSWKNFILLLIR